MARINSVSVGRAAKKLGNMVYYSMNGKTYARARVEQVKNPKTAKQMAQRLIFTTAVRSRDALKSIVDHSFENKKYGSESLNYFMKRNLEILRARAAADNGLTGSFNVPYGITMQANPLLISQGTIPSMVYNFNANAGLYINVGAETIVTVGDFLAQNLTIRKGDQITVLLLMPTTNVEAVTAGGEEILATRLIKMRITIPANIADDAVFFDKTNIVFGSLLITEGLEDFAFVTSNTTISFKESVTNENGLCGCIIVSRPEGKKWLRSTEYMKMNPNYDDGLYNFNDVLNSWMRGTTEIVGLEDNEYLNQGQEAELSNSYNLQTRSFNMSKAADGEVVGVTLAALDTTTSNGSRITQIIYTQTSAQAAAGKISCYKVVSGNTLSVSLDEYNKPANAAALITFDDANRLLGGVLTIQQ